MRCCLLGLLMVFGEGPGQIFHFDELAAQSAAGRTVTGQDQTKGAADEGASGLAETAERDEPLVAVAGRRGAVDPLGTEHVTVDEEGISQLLEPGG